MQTYDLYLDSGPMMKKTFVQVPALPGCTARGDTTQAAADAAPEAIRAYLRFLERHGERVDPDAPFRTRVAEHRTDSAWPGNGIDLLPGDEKPLSQRESDALMSRLAALHDDLRALTGALTSKQLDAAPPKGRPIRRILHHICAEGSYLRGVTGASRVQTQVERGEVDALDALDQLHALELERLRTMPPEERRGVIMRGQSRWTARGALRRMLEHGWEHYVEIATRLKQAP